MILPLTAGPYYQICQSKRCKTYRKGLKNVLNLKMVLNRPERPQNKLGAFRTFVKEGHVTFLLTLTVENFRNKVT